MPIWNFLNIHNSLCTVNPLKYKRSQLFKEPHCFISTICIKQIYNQVKKIHTQHNISKLEWSTSDFLSDHSLPCIYGILREYTGLQTCLLSAQLFLFGFHIPFFFLLICDTVFPTSCTVNKTIVEPYDCYIIIFSWLLFYHASDNKTYSWMT